MILFQAHKSATSPTALTDVRGIHGRKFLMRVACVRLAAAHWPPCLQNLSRASARLRFRRNVSRDRRVLVLLSDLVDLVYIDMPLRLSVHRPSPACSASNDISTSSHVAPASFSIFASTIQTALPTCATASRHSVLPVSGRPRSVDIRLPQFHVARLFVQEMRL